MNRTAMDEVKPLALPKLPAEVLASRNRIFSRGTAWTFKLGGREVDARILPAPGGAGANLAVQGVWGGARFELLVNGSATAVLNGLLDMPVSDAAWRALPAVMRLALWEAGLEPALDALSKKSGETVGLAGIEEFPERPVEDHPDWLHIEWRDRDSGLSLWGALRFPGGQDDFRRVAQFLAGLPDAPRRAPDEWLVEGAVELATERIGLEVVKAAGIGDIVVLAGGLGAAAGKAVLRLGSRLLLPLRLEDGKATVLEEKMPEEKKTVEPARKGAVAADAIEVNLTLELDSRLWQIGDLAQIQPGFVFDTGKPLASPVTLRINGREWGKGEMVDLNGKVGVRLLSLT